MKIYKLCPKCKCPYWEISGTRTADNYSAWQDKNGTWYNGPAHETKIRRCSHCGFSQKITKEHGKIISIEEQTGDHHE